MKGPCIILIAALTVTAPFMGIIEGVLADVPLTQKLALLNARRNWELLYPLKCPGQAYALPLVLDLDCNLTWTNTNQSCWTNATDPCSGNW